MVVVLEPILSLIRMQENIFRSAVIEMDQTGADDFDLINKPCFRSAGNESSQTTQSARSLLKFREDFRDFLFYNTK